VDETVNKSAYNTNYINNYILTKALEGKPQEIVPQEQYEESTNAFMHLMLSSRRNGNIKGIYLSYK